MNVSKPVAISLVCLCAAISIAAQQPDPNSRPMATFGNDRPKTSKPSKFRVIEGVVKDKSDNPVSGAIVQLKDLRTSKVVDFATHDDGKFAFRDLRLDVNYELVAKHDNLVSLPKKVTIYDTRHNVILTFKLEPTETKAQP